MGAERARRAWDVHVIEVDSDERGRATVSVYDPLTDESFDVAVSYVPDGELIELVGLNPAAHYGVRIAHFVETDREVRELVAARFRDAVRSYDPR